MLHGFSWKVYTLGCLTYTDYDISSDFLQKIFCNNILAMSSGCAACPD